MNDRGDFDQLHAWRNRPLCRKYVGAIFRSAVAAVRDRGNLFDMHIYWGLGCHVDGGFELLGTWLQKDCDAAFPAAKLSELHDRGVDDIGLLACVSGLSVPSPPPREAEVRCRRVVFVSEAVSTGSTQLSDVRPAVHRLVLAGELRAQHIQRRLTSALTRRDCFDDATAALNCVAAHLMRVERRFHQTSTRGTLAWEQRASASAVGAAL